MEIKVRKRTEKHLPRKKAGIATVFQINLRHIWPISIYVCSMGFKNNYSLAGVGQWLNDDPVTQRSLVWFHSGHMPWLWTRSPVMSVQKAADHWFSLISVSTSQFLSLILSIKINKNVLKTVIIFLYRLKIRMTVIYIILQGCLYILYFIYFICIYVIKYSLTQKKKSKEEEIPTKRIPPDKSLTVLSYTFILTID